MMVIGMAIAISAVIIINTVITITIADIGIDTTAFGFGSTLVK